MLGDLIRADQSGSDQYMSGNEVRDIYALTPPPSQASRRREAWENSGSTHRSSTLSNSSDGVFSENFTLSRRFNALVLAGSAIDQHQHGSSTSGDHGQSTNLARIGEELEETNPLAIVPDSQLRVGTAPGEPPRPMSSAGSEISGMEQVSLQRVKKEETQSKIMAWQNAEVAKINNRFKREEAVINGWEAEQVQKASVSFKKIERKLEEKRAKAMEKMQNHVVKAQRKGDDKRASAEAKRGTKVANIFEVANLMRAVGRAPSKRSFF